MSIIIKVGLDFIQLRTSNVYYLDDIPESKETLEAITVLKEKINNLKEKLDISDEYFNLIQSMDKMIGETNQVLQKEIGEDFNENNEHN